MADEVQEYPKWVKVSGDGDPLQPGYELANSADEEEALSKPKSKADNK